MFNELRDNLASKCNVLVFTEERLRELRAPPLDPIASIHASGIDDGFVAFCGAGISIPAPAGAPSFLELRDALIRALIGLLAERSVLSSSQERLINAALETLPSRTDLSYPPEMIFSEVQTAMGPGIVGALLACLDDGEPNGNHMGLVRLAEEGRLRGVITPNFDTYIERAFAGSPVARSLPGAVADRREGGFPLVKPHGSIDHPVSIAVTLEAILVRPDDRTLHALERLLAHRTVLVIGYSGWDYDLFPLLAHAGRCWNTRVLWVLWDSDSLNVNVVKLQSVLEDRCTVVHGQRRPILADLAMVPLAAQPRLGRNLEVQFQRILGTCDTTALIAGFTMTVAPIGIDESSGIVDHLLIKLLMEVQRSAVPYAAKLEHLTKIAREAENPDVRATAVAVGKKVAHAAGDRAHIRRFEHLSNPSAHGADPSDELSQIAIELREGFPMMRQSADPERMRQSLRIHTEIRRAELLLQIGESEHAAALAERLLNENICARGGFSHDVWLMKDSTAEGLVHRILADAYAERDDLPRAERALCRALDVFWRQMDWFEFGTAVETVSTLAWADPLCVDLAEQLDTTIQHLETIEPRL